VISTTCTKYHHIYTTLKATLEVWVSTIQILNIIFFFFFVCDRLYHFSLHPTPPQLKYILKTKMTSRHYSPLFLPSSSCTVTGWLSNQNILYTTPHTHTHTCTHTQPNTTHTNPHFMQTHFHTHFFILVHSLIYNFHLIKTHTPFWTQSSKLFCNLNTIFCFSHNFFSVIKSH
jgi:hypothetical protein